jgi:hypothetical protein
MNALIKGKINFRPLNQSFKAKLDEPKDISPHSDRES